MASTPMLRAYPAWVYAAFVIAMILVLTAICFAKGEPPRWRWGDSDRQGSSVDGGGGNVGRRQR
jgi:hypothetical protein